MENLQLIHHNTFSLENYKALIFDLDGTLYDRSYFSLMVAVYSVISANPLLSLRARIIHNKFRGKDLKNRQSWERTYFRLLSSKSGQSYSFVEHWYKGWNYQLLEKVLQRHYKLRPQVNQSLIKLKNHGIKLALISDYPNVKGRMAALNLEQNVFDIIASTIDFGAQKPAPRPFQETADQLGFDSRDVLVIGDKQDADGLAAKQSGKDFFLLQSAEHWQNFLQALKGLGG